MAEPILIYAPRIDLGLPGAVASTIGAPGEFEKSEVGGAMRCYDIVGQWADISYLVEPDGTVSDVQIIRQGSAKPPPSWTRLVTEAIARRRYSPMPADGIPALRVERYSLVSDQAALTGTRIRGGTSTPHLEIVDLTKIAKR